MEAYPMSHLSSGLARLTTWVGVAATKLASVAMVAVKRNFIFGFVSLRRPERSCTSEEFGGGEGSSMMLRGQLARLYPSYSTSTCLHDLGR